MQRFKEPPKPCNHFCLNFCICSIDCKNQQKKSIKSAHRSKNEFSKSMDISFKAIPQFTNHESLPSFTQILSYLNNAFPPQVVTSLADQIRAEEYNHLSVSNRVCLDYNGHGLFSYYNLKEGYNIDEIASGPSSIPFPMQSSTIPFFEVSLKSTNLVSQLQNQGQESRFESEMRKRIMKYMNMSEKDYSMVFTANQVSAFKLLADSYSFKSSQKLLTIYDNKSEATEALIETSSRKGAKVISAEFSWPSLKINSRNLKKMVSSKGKKKRMGLFVFPLQSKVTGARYPYLWMNIAHKNGWHILLDADALGAKAMDTMGHSIFRPDFLICSFYKIFGEDPSGFSCLFVKKSCISVLDNSSTTTGIISLVPSSEDSTSSELKFDRETSSMSFYSANSTLSSTSHQDIIEEIVKDRPDLAFHSTTDASNKWDARKSQNQNSPSLIELLNSERTLYSNQKTIISKGNSNGIECRGLDHADKIGLLLISNRAKYQVNWLVNALLSLHHPNSDNKAAPLVRIYGPKLRFDRGPAVAFNIFDWEGQKIDPALVQKLAGRYNISVACGILENLCFSDKYIKDKEQLSGLEGMMEKRKYQEFKKKGKIVGGVSVLTVSIGFLNNFEDLYRLWAFVSRFLDADFVQKERWKYVDLNQTIVEI